MSTFDAAAFENTVIEESNETKTTPVPEGDYPSIVDKVRIKTITISKGDRMGQTVPILEVMYHILDEDNKLKELLNRDKVTVRQDLWLQVTEDGRLAFGPNQNVDLGRLREATGLNKPGRPFTFGMLEGCGPVMVSVTQDARADTGDVYNKVPRVMAMS